MPKKKEKTYEENIEEFVTQMRNAGVTDKTIKQVLKEVSEYQDKLAREQLEEMFQNWKKIMLEALERGKI